MRVVIICLYMYSQFVSFFISTTTIQFFWKKTHFDNFGTSTLIQNVNLRDLWLLNGYMCQLSIQPKAKFSCRDRSPYGQAPHSKSKGTMLATTRPNFFKYNKISHDDKLFLRVKVVLCLGQNDIYSSLIVEQRHMTMEFNMIEETWLMAMCNDNFALN